MSFTLKEIAKHVGVSTATVSRVLNQRPGVAPEVRDRIMTVVQELNFTPHHAARTLSTSRNQALAFVVWRPPWDLSADEFYPAILMGAERELTSKGYSLLISTIDIETKVESLNLRWLDERRVDGLILAGVELPPRVVTYLIAAGLPTVLAGNEMPGRPIDSVTSDDEVGGYIAAKHLIEHGHRYIAYLSGPREYSVVYNRVKGYLRAMREHGYEPYVSHHPRMFRERGREAYLEMVQREPRITAVLAGNDGMAAGVILAAREAGRRVPDDLAVIGYDDNHIAEVAEPALTTVRIHKEEMGVIAARRLLELLDQGPKNPIRSYLHNELIIRSSCGCTPAALNSRPPSA